MHFAPDGSPVWHSVTEELRSAELPLRQWMTAKLPNVKACFVGFRKTLRINCIEAPPDLPGCTAGAAFDFLLRYILSSEDPADLAIEGALFAGDMRAWSAAATNLAHDLLMVSRAWKSSGWFPQESPPTKLLRGCWALALLTELVRRVRFERSPLAVLGSAPTTEGLLALMPESATDDLLQLYDVSSNTLIPFLSQRDGSLMVGPAFSAILPGDADLIKGRTLVELKALADRRRRDGARRYSLDSRTLYQVVTYGLLGQEKYQLDEVAIFNARYSHLHSWSFAKLVRQLADQPTSLQTLSAELSLFLDDPCQRDVPTAARTVAESIWRNGELPSFRRRREGSQ
jgi:hypothetical protein